MDNDDASDSYTSYTSDSTTLDVSLKAGSGTATCTYDLAIVSEGDTYTKTTGLGDLFEYTVQGKDTGSQKFAEINVDDALNSDIEAGESDETGTQVTEGILGHYKITDKYDSGETQNATTQKWTITSKFYNLAHNQAEQLGKKYVHIVKVVNVKCTNNNEVKESTSDIKVVSGDTDTIGSVISIGDEEFYVISSDDESVTMLAKYNLKVGQSIYFNGEYTNETCESNGGTWFSDSGLEACFLTISTTTEGYNLQSSDYRGNDCDTKTLVDRDTETAIVTYTTATKVEDLKNVTLEQLEKTYYSCDDSSSYSYNGLIAFDSEDETKSHGYWVDDDLNLLPKYGTIFPTYIYDDNATIKKYVDNYKTLLENKYDVTISDARLINYEEIKSLGCDFDNETCITSYTLNNAPWVFDTSYWMGSTKYQSHVWAIDSSGYLNNEVWDQDQSYGVRPVITISKSDISS